MQYGITPITETKALFTLLDGNTKLAEYQFNPKNLKGQQQVSKDTNLPTSEILKAITEVYGAPVRTAKVFTLPERPIAGHDFRVRGMKDEEVPYGQTTDLIGSIKAAIQVPSDSVAEWKGKDSVCCLDIDYHLTAAPNKESLAAMVLTGLVPAPSFWHFTRRGGVHAFYLGGNGLTAEERAGLGYLSWHLLDPTAECQLVTQVRPIPEGETLRESVGDPDGDVVGSWLSGGGVGGDSEEVGELLESNGWAVGSRYSHAVCPIDPTPGDAKNDPVEVTDRGVVCFRCQAKGICYGRTKRPGFASWTAMLGRVECTPIRTCVHNLTHWGHAKWVLQARTTIPAHLLPVCYRGALKVYHSGRPTFQLIPMVFSKDTEWLVRGEGCWQTVEQGYVFPKEIGPLLSCLPACNRWDEEKGVAKSSPPTVNLFQQPTLDLTDRGYQPIEVLKGIRLHADNSDEGRLLVTTPASWLKKYSHDFHPKYLSVSKRLAEKDAQDVLNCALPGINWQYLYALILARGANEAKVGLHPYLIVDGVSGAGKSTHVKVAASILGDVASEVPMDANVEKYRSGVRDSSKEGSFIITDEFLKDSLKANSKLTPEQVLDPILNLNEDSKSHKMYVGPTALGHLGVLVFTETRIPAYLKDYTQIARRVHYLRLDDPVYWEQPLARLGLDSAVKLRCGSLQLAHACNSIVSWIIDRFFGFRLTFEQLAAEIGVTTLLKSEAFEDMTPQLLELYRLVCEARDPDDADKKRFSGRGYKVIRRNDAENPDLAALWGMLADGNGEQWGTSKRVSEKSFKHLLGVSDTVHVDVSATSSIVAIRFRQGPIKNPDKVNGEITKP